MAVLPKRMLRDLAPVLFIRPHENARMNQNMRLNRIDAVLEAFYIQELKMRPGKPLLGNPIEKGGDDARMAAELKWRGFEVHALRMQMPHGDDANVLIARDGTRPDVARVLKPAHMIEQPKLEDMLEALEAGKDRVFMVTPKHIKTNKPAIPLDIEQQKDVVREVLRAVKDMRYAPQYHA